MTLSAEFSALQRASDLAADVSSDLRTAKNAMDDQIRTLTSEGWKGAAAESFEAAWAGWAEAATKVIEALGTEGTLLAAHKVALETSDDTATDAMGVIRGRLGPT